MPVLIGLAAVGAGSCGSSSHQIDTAGGALAKQHLIAAYREANRSTKNVLRCSSSNGPANSPPCRHPHFYASSRLLQAEIGSTLLHQLTVDVAKSPENLVRTRTTYIVSTRTGGHSITLAEKAPDGITWVLSGSLSKYRISKLH